MLWFSCLQKTVLHNPLPIFSSSRTGPSYEVNTPEPIPLGPVSRLPQEVVLVESATFSTILAVDLSGRSGSSGVPGHGNADYISLLFLPDGSTSLAGSGTSSGDYWFVSVAPASHETSGDRPSDNFATLMVDPVSGTVSTFQP